MKRVLLLISILLLTGCDRGAYWYRHPGQGDSYGIEEFAAQKYNAISRDDLVAMLAGCSVTRLYGSYGTTAEDDPAWMNWWLSQLHAQGIESHLLLDQTSWLGEGPTFPSLIDAIDERILALLVSASVLAYWDGVHLDIEPQASGGCTTQADCYSNMLALLDLVTVARAYLNANVPTVRLHSSIWYRLSDVGTPPTFADAKVAWPGATVAAKEASRDAWSAAFLAQLDGISVLAYDPDLVDVVAKTDYERTLPTEVRVAVRESDFGSLPWSGGSGGSMVDLVVGLWFDTLAQSDLYDLNDILARGGCEAP
jgi:hypothetical protein